MAYTDGVLLAFLIGVALAALLAGGVALWLRRGRARRPARLPRLRHPVVLAHGVLGFDKIAFAGKDHSYFRGVTGHLTRVGTEVHRPCVPSSASIVGDHEEAQKIGPGEGAGARAPVRVNDFETVVHPRFSFACVVPGSGFSFGLLIHAAVGDFGGCGSPRTKRFA